MRIKLTNRSSFTSGANARHMNLTSYGEFVLDWFGSGIWRCIKFPSKEVREGRQLPSAGSALGHKALGTVTAAEWVELRSIPRIQAAVIVETPFHADSGADDVAISSAETSNSSTHQCHRLFFMELVLNWRRYTVARFFLYFTWIRLRSTKISSEA